MRDKTSLLVDDESSESFVSNPSDIKTSFSKNLEDGITLEFEDTQLTMLPIFVDLDKYEGALSEDSKNVVYDCGESVSLDYELTYTGFKENIILDQYSGISKFDFLLNTNGLKLTLNSENELKLYDENENQATTIGDIIIYDSDNNISFGNLSFEEIDQNNEYIISVNVDSDFLTSPDTIYPVYVDPTIEIDYEHSEICKEDGTPGIVHATFYSDDTSVWGETMKVGKTNSITVARSVMKFTGLTSLINLFQMDRTLITGANVYIRDIGYQSDNNAININCHNLMNYAPYLVIDYNDPESEYRYSENADISYTYKTSMRLTAGKTYKFRTGKATNYSGCNTELYLFKSDEMEPGNNSWYNNDISSNNRYSEIEATISSTGV